MDNQIVASTRHLNAPRIAANLAVLNEGAVPVTLDVDFQLLAAKRTRDRELVWHCRRSYPCFSDLVNNPDCQRYEWEAWEPQVSLTGRLAVGNCDDWGLRAVKSPVDRL